MRHCLILVVLFTGVFATNATAEGHESLREIVVNGEATVRATPDVALVRLGVSQTAAEADTALRMTSETIERLLARLEAVGTEERDVQTTNISLFPRYENSPNEPGQVLSGYLASNSLSVRLRDLSSLGEVIDLLVGEGANTINSISFGIVDPRPLEMQARREAVMIARSKAEVLADAADVKLGAVRRISEIDANVSQPRMSGLATAEAAVPIAAGEIEIRQSVTVVFDIAD